MESALNVKIVIGKAPVDVCKDFEKFLNAFRGDVVVTLNFLILRYDIRSLLSLHWHKCIS